MKKYLELFKNGFDSTVEEKTKVENWPYVGYSPSEGVVFTVIPEPATEPSDNEIWYTSKDGNIVTPYYTNVFGASLVSNNYDDFGLISFDTAVTSVGKWAFYKRSSLTSITIPNSVTSIGDSAFLGCSSLTSIVIPDGVTSIVNRAFQLCTSLTSITIPESVTTIGEHTFYECSALTSITIPNSIISIGQSAFALCYSLTSITIPNSVMSIGGNAFYSCESLTSIVIPDSVTRIGSCVFNGCFSLTSMIVEEGNTTYDSRGNCNAIVETATNTLIEGCQNTIIPNSVTSIGKYAFRDCSSLTSITIPNSVTSIGDYAFNGCSSLTSITCEATTPPTLGSSNNLSSVTVVYVPTESVDAYKVAKNWNYYASKIQPIQ